MRFFSPVVALVATFLLGGASRAATFTVTNLSDATTNGVCDALGTGDGCTIREAVKASNAATSDSTIEFDSGVSGVLTLQKGELYILNHNVSINGPGASNLTIDGADTSRIFKFELSTSTVQGLTLSHGKAAPGGAIVNLGTLQIRNCIFTQNSASSGGALYNNGTLMVEGCTISNNTSDSSGGGIQNGRTLTITNSRIEDNKAAVTSVGGGISTNGTLNLVNTVVARNQAEDGAGLYCWGTVDISFSTIRDNSASGDTNSSGLGGGLRLQDDNGTATIRNSTISGNSGRAGGGLSSNGRLNVSNTTLDSNTGTYLGGGIYSIGEVVLSHCTLSRNNSPFGGAVHNGDSTALLTLGNTLLQRGTQGNNVFLRELPLTSRGYNISDDTTGVSGATDKANTSVSLAALGDNGGPTQTCALASGSPAINAGAPNFNGAGQTDQRGEGFDRVSGGRLDIGAYEFQLIPVLSVANVSVKEGQSGTTSMVFNVTMSTATSRDVSFDYAFSPGTATADSDFVATSGTLTIVAGQTSGQASLSINGDTDIEDDETLTLTLTKPQNAVFGANRTSISATGTILTDDFAPTATPVPTSTPTPTSTPSPTATPTLTPVPTATPTTAPTATPTVIPTATPTAIPTATPTAMPTAIPTATPTAIPTATPTPVPPVITVVGSSVQEGNSGARPLIFTVKLSKASAQTVKVNVQTAPASAMPATANTDYIPLGRSTLSFKPGQTVQTVAVQVRGDVLDEDNERIKLALSSPLNATLGIAGAEGTIIDDDGVPSLSINDVALREGSKGLVKMVFTVKLSNPSSKTIALKWATQSAAPYPATAGSSAVPGVDYLSVPPTALTFAPFQTSKTVSVAVQGDLLNEENETFSVRLSAAANASIRDGSGIGTIINDDGLPALSVKAGTAVEGNSGIANLPFTLTLSAPSARPITVGVRPIAGSIWPATANLDYVATPLINIAFAPGQTSKTVNVAIKGDTLDEENESVALEVSRPVNVLVNANFAQGVILDNDSAPSLSIGDVSIEEGNGGTTQRQVAVFTSTLSAATGKEVRVDFESYDRNAQAGADYLPQKGNLVFAPGETSKTVAVPIVGDTRYEPNEIFGIVLSRAINATVSKSTASGTILNDDVPAGAVASITASSGSSS